MCRDWIFRAQNRETWRDFVKTGMILRFHKTWRFLDQMRTYKIPKKVSATCSWPNADVIYFITNSFFRIYGGLLLTPWCRVLLEKLTGLQLVKKFAAFHGTRRFITALTSVRQLSLSWASPIQSKYPHPTSQRSIQVPIFISLCMLRDVSPRNTFSLLPPSREIRVGEQFTSGLFFLMHASVS